MNPETTQRLPENEWLDVKELHKELSRRGRLLKRRQRRIEKMQAVVDAARAYGTNQDLAHDETGDPHDRTICRTCTLADALGLFDFGATADA